MRPLFPSIIIFLICLAATASKGQNIPYKVFDTYGELNSFVNKYSESTVVVNFWATYCAPCVQEIPYLDSLQKKYADRRLQVILVNLDFRHQLKQRLEPFLEKHHLSAKVVVLADQDADVWIPKVSQDWDGGLPFTMVIKDGKKFIHRQEFSDFEALERFVLPHLGAVEPLAAKRRR
jgi:thiol-disulfide isomerase/thioredoxin